MALGNLGPVELLIVKFPGNHFSGQIVAALKKVVDDGTIRVIDIIFAIKNSDGELAVLEINELDDEDYGQFDPVVEQAGGLLSPEDVRGIGMSLERNSSAALLLFEHTWATEFRDAIVNANGEVLVLERIPRNVVQEMLADSAEAGA